ncbi:hypothetical protein ACFQ1L_09355 [Phytohabitans flavus]
MDREGRRAAVHGKPVSRCQRLQRAAQEQVCAAVEPESTQVEPPLCHGL